MRARARIHTYKYSAAPVTCCTVRGPVRVDATFVVPANKQHFCSQFTHSAMGQETNRIELQGTAWISAHNSSAIGAGPEGQAARASEGNYPREFVLRRPAHEEQEHILHAVLAVRTNGRGDVS